MSLEYVTSQLGANERVLYTERHHWIFPIAEMIKWIFAALLIAAVVIALDIWLLSGAGWIRWGYLILLIPLARIVWGFVAWRMNVYVLTNRRVAEVTGVIRKKVSDSSLEKLTDVVLSQGVLGRLLHYGSIEILTAAAGAGVNYLKQIRRPLEFKQAMVNAKEELEREFGGSN
jgi:uncharacterized membrane protein YdbT with pleckstrin-like domain